MKSKWEWQRFYVICHSIANKKLFKELDDTIGLPSLSFCRVFKDKKVFLDQEAKR